MSAKKQAGERANRLAGETSPYLLQHAHNPVDWYPWGAEALERARREDRPIFLSIGYSACHWCHVMERESFENEAIAQVLNENFVPVKVDREERPDLDEIYMTATQMMSGSGGWPMSVFLTPDLKPFFAGTYFPPEDGTYGRAGFKRLCLELARAWRDRRSEVERVAENAVATIGQVLGGRAEPGAAARSSSLRPELIARAVQQMGQDFDPVHGGFGRAPKFPPSLRLALFLREYRRNPSERLRAMTELTLDRMARGGIYDQVGGGFHRYSVDEKWLVPHFEKMLYDNALLAWVYLDAGQALQIPSLHRVARQILDDMLREFHHPEGGFYSTLDADSEGEEGKYYVWSPEQVIEALGEPDGNFFNSLFDVTSRGNFEGKNIPNLLRQSLPEAAAELKVPLAELEARVDRLRQRLLEVRSRRAAPGLDDKVLASWNGLMIRAFARGYELLGEARYLAAAEGAAEFILTRMRRDGRLLASYRNGQAKLNAYLDDYAFLAVGMLHLHSATGEGRWLEEARALADALNQYFWDDEAGGYFFTSRDHESLIARPKSAQDSAIPSGNGMAALAQAELSQRTGESGYRERAERTIIASMPQVEQMPSAFATMLCALDALLHASPPAQPGQDGKVAVEARPPSAPVRPGETFRVGVRLSIPAGLHLNSNAPGEDTLFPTRLEVQPLRSFEVLRIDYPTPQKTGSVASGELQSVYEGDVEIEVELRAAEGIPATLYTLAASVTYQACTERECLPPATQKLEIPVRVG
jgi:uncharacterized protein YyaL (SSP411 family)